MTICSILNPLQEMVVMPPQRVLDTAEELRYNSQAHPEKVGDSMVVDGFWIESHTIGCQTDWGNSEDEAYDVLFDVYNKYKNDGISTVIGDISDGIFVSITPQNSLS